MALQIFSLFVGAESDAAASNKTTTPWPSTNLRHQHVPLLLLSLKRPLLFLSLPVATANKSLGHPKNDSANTDAPKKFQVRHSCYLEKP